MAVLAAGVLPVSGCMGGGAGSDVAALKVPASCRQFVPKKVLATPPGVLTPPGVRLFPGIVHRGDFVRVSGFMAIDAATFQALARSAGMRVIFSEAEHYESETLYTDGTWRNFWVVQNACPGGSRFIVHATREQPVP